MAVSILPATGILGTIALVFQPCCCEQLTNDEVRGHDDEYDIIAIFYSDQLTSDEVWGNDYVIIASLWM